MKYALLILLISVAFAHAENKGEQDKTDNMAFLKAICEAAPHLRELGECVKQEKPLAFAQNGGSQYSLAIQTCYLYSQKNVGKMDHEFHSGCWDKAIELLKDDKLKASVEPCKNKLTIERDESSDEVNYRRIMEIDETIKCYQDAFLKARNEIDRGVSGDADKKPRDTSGK